MASSKRFWAAVLCQPSSDFQEPSKGKIFRIEYFLSDQILRMVQKLRGVQAVVANQYLRTTRVKNKLVAGKPVQNLHTMKI